MVQQTTQKTARFKNKNIKNKCLQFYGFIIHFFQLKLTIRMCLPFLNHKKNHKKDK